MESMIKMTRESQQIRVSDENEISKKFQFRKLPNAYSVIIGSYRDTFNTIILAFTVIQINKANPQKDFIYSFIVNVN